MVITENISSVMSLAGYAWRTISARNKKLFVTVLLLLCAVVYGNVAYLTLSKTSIDIPSLTAASAQAETPAPTPSPETKSSAAIAPTPQPETVTATAPLRSCTPSNYTLPSALDVTARPAGLTEVVDPIQYYSIYGATAAQARKQIQQCAPRESAGAAAAEYTAQTGYYISWQYSYTSRDDGLCVVTNPKIGLHVSMVLPSLEFSAGASDTFKTQWRQFASNLQGHEQGHVEIDRQYARQMLADLQSFPPSACNTLQQSVSSVMRNVVAQLNAANDHYDDETGHGATQGAVIPQ